MHMQVMTKCVFKLFHKLTAVPTYTFICYVSSYGPMAKGPGGHATNVHNIYKIKYSRISYLVLLLCSFVIDYELSLFYR